MSLVICLGFTGTGAGSSPASTPHSSLETFFKYPLQCNSGGEFSHELIYLLTSPKGKKPSPVVHYLTFVEAERELFVAEQYLPFTAPFLNPNRNVRLRKYF